MIAAPRPQSPELEARYDEVVAKVLGYSPGADIEQLRRAFDFAAEMHSGQKRKSGEPYIGHPLEVTSITADMHLDNASLYAALLHDTVEDTDAKFSDIAERFGQETADLVEGLTKISKLKFKSEEEAQAENVRKLIVAMGQDIRVILVKLADRLHNIRTLGHMSPAKQRRIARETVEIYAPLANRLGINWIKNELEDFSFKYLNPEAYEMLKIRIAETRSDREKYIREVTSVLDRIVKQRGMSAEVQGRPKHFSSIWDKMQGSQVDFEQIFDLTAFRIIVDDKALCYEVLGLVHDLWKPVPGRFKDYIAVPKPNGYQSLHTTVVGPKGQRVEIQIRTSEMHRIAEHGVAAHWAYKEGKGAIDAAGNQFAWLRQLVQSQADFDDSLLFVESMKLDLFSDEVFVFTPNGDIISLPKGATPLDFAYAIHSQVGDHAVHAKVNGRGVSLRHALVNGDNIEIMTRADQYPREEWLDIVKSSRAKAKIRQSIRKEKRERVKELAKNMLVSELKRYGIRYEAVLKSGDLQATAELLKLQNVDQMLAAVGYGKLQKETVVAKIVPPDTNPKNDRMLQSGAFKKIGQRIAQFIGRPNDATVKLTGVDGETLVTYARCCNPVYGEEIVGYVTRGRGVVAHLKGCARIENLEPERRIEVEWSSLTADAKKRDRTRDTTAARHVTLRILCQDESGLLSTMSAALTSRGVNIAQAHCRTSDDGSATCMFDVMVVDVNQLNDAVRALNKIDGVVAVERVQA